MSDPRFAPGAVRLAGLTARLFGWRPAEFWAATPAELACVLTPPTSDGTPVSRTELNHMMERENDRPG